MEGDDWREAVGNGHFAFYAGAGISIPSGVGGWEEHYRPILSALSASYLENGTDLPEALQLLAATPTRARKVFDAFSDSFMLKGATPNSFHFAMLRSGAEHVWTSNYDSLLESANTLGRFDRRIDYRRGFARVLDLPFGKQELTINIAPAGVLYKKLVLSSLGTRETLWPVSLRSASVSTPV